MMVNYQLHIVMYWGLAWLIIMGSGFDDWVYWHFFTITVNGGGIRPSLQKSKSMIKLWSLSLMLRPMVSWPVYLGIKHPSGAYDQIFITVKQLRVCWCGVLSLTREQVCRLQLLLALASTIIFGSESCGTRDRILLSQIWDFPFRRLLRLALPLNLWNSGITPFITPMLPE
jgi:hypothetical protein